MVALLVVSGIAKLAPAGGAEFVALAAVLALMVGVIQLAMGVFRLGFLVTFLSHPVVGGFVSASALVIGANQLKYFLGIELPRSKFVHEILVEAWGKIGSSNPWALGIGAGSIALLLILRRIDKRLPGALLVVILGTLLAWSIGPQRRGWRSSERCRLACLGILCPRSSGGRCARWCRSR